MGGSMKEHAALIDTRPAMNDRAVAAGAVAAATSNKGKSL
jgi:hypothetical protein